MIAPAAPSIYLDANILIYLVEGYAEQKAALGCLLDVFENGRVNFVTSELSLAEVLVQPLRQNRPDLIQRYEQLLAPGSGIAVAAIDFTTLRRSAEYRAANGGSLLDAIHVATAASSDCSIFLSEDARIKVIEPIKHFSLSDFVERFGP